MVRPTFPLRFDPLHQVLGQQRGEGFGELDPFDLSLIAYVDGLEEALVELPPDRVRSRLVLRLARTGQLQRRVQDCQDVLVAGPAGVQTVRLRLSPS